VHKKNFVSSLERRVLRRIHHRVVEHSVISIMSSLRKCEECTKPTPFEVLEKVNKTKLLNTL
jgi:hypothetical protein